MFWGAEAETGKFNPRARLVATHDETLGSKVQGLGFEGCTVGFRG